MSEEKTNCTTSATVSDESEPPKKAFGASARAGTTSAKVAAPGDEVHLAAAGEAERLRLPRRQGDLPLGADGQLRAHASTSATTRA